MLKGNNLRHMLKGNNLRHMLKGNNLRLLLEGNNPSPSGIALMQKVIRTQFPSVGGVPEGRGGSNA
jgi:hypothetical protein